jgi:phosphatidylserine decarboxylase
MRIAAEGWPFIGGCLVAAAVFFLGARSFHSVTLGVLTGVAVLAALFCTYFFRDPERTVPTGAGLILSPADGRVLEIVEEKDAASNPVRVVRIFLSVFDVHTQRAPFNATVGTVRYVPGKFLDARDPRAPFENEQNHIELKTDMVDGSVTVTQIAGLIARRIVCQVKTGQQVVAGQRLGLIRFGSQVDVTLPMSVDVRVKQGERVAAGLTILGVKEPRQAATGGVR